MGKLRVLNRTSTIPNLSLVQKTGLLDLDMVVVEEEKPELHSLTGKGLGLIGPKI